MGALAMRLARNPWAWAVVAALGLALYECGAARAYKAAAQAAEARAQAAEAAAAQADAAREMLAAAVRRWQAEAAAAKQAARIARVEALALVESERARYLDAIARDPLPVGDCPAILDWLGRQHAATLER